MPRPLRPLWKTIPPYVFMGQGPYYTTSLSPPLSNPTPPPRNNQKYFPLNPMLPLEKKKDSFCPLLFFLKGFSKKSEHLNVHYLNNKKKKKHFKCRHSPLDQKRLLTNVLGPHTHRKAINK